MRTSAAWIDYFQRNAESSRDFLSSSQLERLSNEELADVTHSLGAIVRGLEQQAGSPQRTDSGVTAGAAKAEDPLVELIADFGNQVNDPDLHLAMRLFSDENQRHAELLRGFMHSCGVPEGKPTFIERTVQRWQKMRLGAEHALAVQLMSETVSKVLLMAMKDATTVQSLYRICDQIVDDKVSHVEFVAQQLGRIQRQRQWVVRRLKQLCLNGLYLLTLLFVWLWQNRLLRLSGYSFNCYLFSTWREYQHARELACNAMLSDANDINATAA